MDETTHILTLLHKYHRNDISAAEWRELQQWAATHPAYQQLLEDFSPARHKSLAEADAQWTDYFSAGRSLSFQQLLDRLDAEQRKVRKKYLSWAVAAASLLVVGFCGIYLWTIRQTAHTTHQEQVLAVVPGSKKATLLADNGIQHEITDGNGVLVKDNGLFYSDGRAVVENQHLSNRQLSLVVPRGGEYMITLPDSTRVWLNSNSTLRFPPDFQPDSRTVSLIGEAYFEVAHDRNRPFVVKSEYQEITVLGTTFNVKAYHEDDLNTTTLIEGSVQVHSHEGQDRIKLRPGQASVVGKDQQLKAKIQDIQQAISWKQGEFSFNHTPFEEVVKQISRWYDLDVEYKNGIPQEYFTGQLSRSVEFDIVLGFLKESRIDVELVSNKLIVH